MHTPIEPEPLPDLPEVVDALDAWRLQFSNVRPAELSDDQSMELARIRSEHPDARAGRVGGRLFAYFVDGVAGPCHVRLGSGRHEHVTAGI